jgi:hypothetical protein
MFLNLNAMTTTLWTNVHHTILTTATLTSRANHLPLYRKIFLNTSVKVAQWQRYRGLFVGPPLFALLMPKVTAAAKKARKQVKWVMMTGWSATLLVLLYAFVAVLVVDAAKLFVGEHIVGFSHGNEFVVRALVATRFMLAFVSRDSLVMANCV